MSCKITANISNEACEYALAGIVAIYIANYYTPNVVTTLPTTPVANTISYTENTDGVVTGMQLPADEYLYRIDVAEGTGSFADQLLAGGNGGKYRQHQVNGTVNVLDADILNGQADAISLGKFVAVVETAKGFHLLGRYGGLSAPANGMDYASGAAAADANGWTLVLQGATIETSRMILNTVVTPLLAPADEVTP